MTGVAGLPGVTGAAGVPGETGVALVTVAHGTRHATGNEVARSLTSACGSALEARAVASYVELCEPSLASVMTGMTGPAAVVPLLLSTGYHVREDLPAAASLSLHPVALAPPLGPDPVLAVVQATRLVEAGARPGQPVVLVAAGSTDPQSDDDLEGAVAHLASVWDGPVSPATLSGRGRRPADVVRPGDAVSPYLLSPGFFARRAREESLAAGAAVVADVLGPHPALVDLVCARYQSARRQLQPRRGG